MVMDPTLCDECLFYSQLEIHLLDPALLHCQQHPWHIALALFLFCLFTLLTLWDNTSCCRITRRWSQRRRGLPTLHPATVPHH